MLRLIPNLAADAPLSLLCLGAHSDDIEIGCGGTILRLLAEYPHTEVHWIVFAGEGLRADEAAKSASRFLADAGRHEVVINQFKDGFFPYVGADIKQLFEALKKKISPNLIFTHYRHDLHQDHRLISELTWNTFLDHLILEYEIAKYDGDIGTPNFFVHLNSVLCRKKVDHILQCFSSQTTKAWFSEDTFYAVLRIRGLESNAPEKYAEAFYSRKMIF